MRDRKYTDEEDRMLKRGREKREHRIPEERMITRLIPNGPPQALYDIGVGCYYEFRTLKIIYPELRVFGVEPDPEEYADLLPIFGGTLFNCALGWEHGWRNFEATGKGKGGGSFYRAHDSRFTTINVEVRTLDDFDSTVGGYQYDKILLWLDVEDSELDVLEGGKNLLRSGRVEWMNIETRHQNEPGMPTTAKVSAFLADYGYRPVHRYNVNGEYPEAAGDTVYFKNGVEPLIPAEKGMPF